MPRRRSPRSPYAEGRLIERERRSVAGVERESDPKALASRSRGMRKQMP